MFPVNYFLYLQIIIFLFITPGTPRIVIVSHSVNYGVNDVLVFLNGVCLTPTTDYTISGTTLTLPGGAPPAGSNIVVRYLPLTG